MSKGVLGPVQVLRAIAASMVVIAHCYDYVLPKGRAFANLGTLGVAIFFIISGFIMYYTNDWTGEAKVSGRFVARRLHRIVPLYWLLTTMTLLMLIASGEHPAIRQTGLSYLFVPYGFDGVKFRPILGVGWTLDFEMFFYSLFALALLLPMRIGLPAILAGLTVFGLSALHLPEPLAALSQPIILLFGVGIALGWVRDRFQTRIPPAFALVPALLTPAFFLDPTVSKLVFLPAVWTVAFLWAVSAIFSAERKSSRFGLWLGDASYLLYLVHPLILSVIGWVTVRAGLTTIREKIAVAALMFCASIATAMIGHLVVEKPLARITRPFFSLRPGMLRRRREINLDFG